VKTFARWVSPVALAIGLLAAGGAVGFAVRGPIDGLDLLLTVTAVFFLPTGLVGFAILRTTPTNRIGWLLLVAGAALPLSVLCQSISDAAFVHHDAGIGVPTAFALVGGFVSVFAVPMIALFGLLLFPDGHLAEPGQPVRRRTRWLARTCAVMLAALFGYALFNPSLAGTTADNAHNPIGFGPAGILLIAVLLIGPVGAMTSAHLIGRARTASTADHRRALTLAGRASIVIPVAFVLCLAIGLSGGNTAQIGVVENFAAITIGLASWVAIIRYGLFDRRAVLSRTLRYAALTVVVVAVYLGVDLILHQMFAGAVPAVIAAALGALVVLPMRDLVQRRVNRLVFGLRDEPATAFGLLAVRLDAAAAPEDVLPAVVRTIGESLRLRHVAIEVGGEDVASWGEPIDGAKVELDLPFAGESIGRLTVQSHDPAQPFVRSDRDLLESLASQVSVAARAVALTHALQASRERLVTSREEERRRLRRDLHDGLGPTMAGIALGIDTVRRSLPADAPADNLLVTLRKEAENAVTDIRRIAYNLRPPILDEMGLVGAIREQALRFGGTCVLPLDLPILPAAVEAAAYHIAIEAMTNASRHAPGSPMQISVIANGSLELEISDSGAGMREGFRAGIGVTSMRERAAELGGECVLTSRTPHGTIVRARLPLVTVQP